MKNKQPKITVHIQVQVKVCLQHMSSLFAFKNLIEMNLDVISWLQQVLERFVT